MTVVFQGAGTRWPSVVSAPEHPAHSLYGLVSDRIAGVSSACATVFGASEGAVAAGLPLISENAVPGTKGLPSMRNWMVEGRQILLF